MKQFFVNTWATILRVGTALIAVFRGAGQDGAGGDDDCRLYHGRAARGAGQK